MRIIFMGTPEFAIPSLGTLIDHGYSIVAVVTVPDKPRGRGQNVTSSPVKDFALEHGIPVLQPENLRDPGFEKAVNDLQPDLIVVVAFRILPPAIFQIPRLGSFNLHASILPKYRGAAPINWAIMRGENETGVTTFFLQQAVDTGAVLFQSRLTIGPEETAGELHDRLAGLGAQVVLETVQAIEAGSAKPRDQDNLLATPAPKIFKEQCAIPWSRPAAEIHNLIRGLSPHPCAWTVHHGRVLRVFRATLLEGSVPGGNFPPGVLADVRVDRAVVSTGQGFIALQEVQQEGRKRMGIAEFLRGYPMESGESLTGLSS